MGAKKRILLVDGDADSRAVYRIILQHYGFDVYDTSDGAEGVRLARTLELAAVVTELTLDSLDGHALVEQLRSDPATRGLCIIVLTARGLREERERAEHAGCTRFLTKPIEPNALAALVLQQVGAGGVN